jgi:NAD(P)-dependent dehydrogenase (short-subunit alcohol dehydrogenase family)
MALGLGPIAVRVNAVVPGMIRTPMTAPMFEDPETCSGFARLIRLVARVNPKRSRQRSPSSCPTMPVSSSVWLFRLMARHTKTTCPGLSISLAPSAGRGWGEGPFFEFGLERFENPIEVIDDIVVPEADHAIAKGA